APVRTAAEDVGGTTVLPTSKILTVYIESDVKYDLDYVRSSMDKWNLKDNDTGEYYYTLSDESTENRLVLKGAVRSVEKPGEDIYYFLSYPRIACDATMHHELKEYIDPSFPTGSTYGMQKTQLSAVPASVTLQAVWNNYNIITCVLNKGKMYRDSGGFYHGAKDSGISSMKAVTTKAYFRYSPGSGENGTYLVPKAPSGYKFAGWYKDSALTKKVSWPVTVSKDITIYAKYAKVYKEGLVTNSTGKRYRLTDGSYLKSRFKTIGGDTYYFLKSGYAATGWKTIASKRYHFASSGIMDTGWKKISGSWYHFTANGVMETGWKSIGRKWYYFTPEGVMVTGWQKIAKKWYYFSGSGVMLKGWQKISKKWYYFNSGGDMVTGWKKLSGKWYYFKSSGVMVTGTLKIGTKTYQFSSSGVCLNP
ncbi:MAG: InlB B-repeat-containing protein, partial [Solobacterium sp.]|nr:InlB B-repeat-containing protein [Solobacterium sp.]